MVWQPICNFPVLLTCFFPQKATTSRQWHFVRYIAIPPPKVHQAALQYAHLTPAPGTKRYITLQKLPAVACLLILLGFAGTTMLLQNPLRVLWV
jgi:hypothetical protein